MNTTNSQWPIRVAALAIFLLGFAAGALTLNVYHHRQMRQQAMMSARPSRFEQLTEQLGLTREQKTQVEQILGEARSRIGEVRKQSLPQMKEVREQTDERLKAVLTPQQWEKFQQVRQEWRSRRGGR
jgi:Spy/CpxP family protein refolding chaperone